MLINCLSLRRPKNTVELPPISNQKRRLDFSQAEMRNHNLVKQCTKAQLASIDASLNNVNFVNTLQRINELRLMCNHGQREPQEMETLSASWSQANAQKCFDSLESSGLAKCSDPACDQDLSSVLANEEDQIHDDDPWISEELIVYCNTCRHTESHSQKTQTRVCNHIPRHNKKVNIGKDKVTTSYGEFNEEKPLPTKLQALFRDLVETPAGIKR